MTRENYNKLNNNKYKNDLFTFNSCNIRSSKTTLSNFDEKHENK